MLSPKSFLDFGFEASVSHFKKDNTLFAAVTLNERKDDTLHIEVKEKTR